MDRKLVSRILSIFVFWRVALFIIAFFAVSLLPTFGGRFPYADRVLEITKAPAWVWGFGNFDGVHYLRIAQDGYSAQFSQAFFPFFSILVRVFANLFPKDQFLNITLFVDPVFFWSGLFLSSTFFLFSLFMLYKLFSLDFKSQTSLYAILLLVAFPTSFYFGAIYTESLFLLLTVSSLYFLRKRSYLLSAFLIALSTATRVMGIFLLVVYLIEVFKDKKWDLKVILGFLIAPLGLLAYMYFLNANFNDPFYFFTSQPIFGAERTSSSIIFLPQVIFRYLKIFATVGPTTLPFFNAFLEFIFTIVPLGLLIFLYKKMRFSYWVFSILCILLPTFTGTLSSMPRYSLMAFLALPFLSNFKGPLYKITIFIFIILNVILTSLFIRGYWVA